MKDYELEDILNRLEGMRDTLRDEHGAEWDYFHDQFNRELVEHAIDLGLELLKCKRPSSSNE